MDWLDQLAVLLRQGGYVMIPLLALSVLSLGLIFERTVFWLRFHRPGVGSRVRKLNTLLRKGKRDEALKHLRRDHTPYGRIARQLIEHGTGEAVALEAVDSQRPRIERFMVTLSTIITAAPLLGILGTVVGIISSFHLLGEQTTLADLGDVSAGIAEALLTTAFGLVIALVTLFPYMIFRGQVERMLGRLETVIAAARETMNANNDHKT